jgi:hypothetical protein
MGKLIQEESVACEDKKNSVSTGKIPVPQIPENPVLRISKTGSDPIRAGFMITPARIPLTRFACPFHHLPPINVLACSRRNDRR